ncbi:MAG: hypothetical protein R3190_16490, partial [Thermoanaerobaculia bacterium]|nr:hypothetical protein [Thermoanaerobaculia bacterium]
MSSIPDAPRLATGRTVARILAGSWRAEPPTPEVSRGEWMAALPVLLSGGCGALAWRSSQATAVAGTAIDRSLRDAFDRYQSQARAQED